MRKNVFGRRFKRDANERKALFKSLMSSLVLDEKIKTTEAKAKSIKASVEKLVTIAKKREEDAGRFLSSYLTPPAIEKIINKIAPQFKDRPGGYTRIVRMGNRISDSASMVLIEWTEFIKSSQASNPRPKKTKVAKPKQKIVPSRKTNKESTTAKTKKVVKPKSKVKSKKTK